MLSSRLPLALSALLVTLLAAQSKAQVAVTRNNAIHFESLTNESGPTYESVPPRQMSYKSYTFSIKENESLDAYTVPGEKLEGRKPLGRIFLITTCEAKCNTVEPELHRTVFVNVGKNATQSEWVQAAFIDGFGVTIKNDIFKNPELEFALNGNLIHDTGSELHVGNSSVSHYYLQVFEPSDSCRKYKASYGPDARTSGDDDDSISVDLPWKPREPQVANGIVVGAPKVYDTYALRNMLNSTAQKLSQINPFVAGQITGNYGNLQGVTRDQSYLNAQVQVSPPAAATVSSITAQSGSCPAGYYPYGALGCQPVASGAATTVPPATSLSETITPAAPVTPAIPAAPTYNPLTAPSNVGQSSADALVEQVQLSGQLQIYQLLLQGAQSDTLLVENSRAIATRAQTTIGFPISIDPPRQFRRAVAEVRILIEPYPTPESGGTPPVSIVNLLPSQKTYNVAKITSKQKSFGGAAVIDQVVNAGVSGGKSKDRLYLAKDTDTVALQYDHPSVKPLGAPFPEKVLTSLEVGVRMQKLSDCDDEWFVEGPVEPPTQNLDAKTLNDRAVDAKRSRSNSVVFGWQFRPVLGADYVLSGPRQVFAQLALPEGLDESTFSPAVMVQTRWREYDERKQVVGPVFHSSCTVTAIKDPVIIQNPLRVRDSTWDDIGGGLVKIKTHGSFFSPGISLQSGSNTYPAVAFTGQELQFFAPAKDLITNGEIKLVGESNQTASITIPINHSKEGCEINSTWLWAIPQADGTSRVRVTLEPGKGFKSELPHAKPLVLIGSDVYGLRDKPFQNGLACDKGMDSSCVYHFTATTADLRTASNFYLRELDWSGSNLQGPIHFAPFLASLSPYSSSPQSPSVKPAQKKASGVSSEVTYLASGTDLRILHEATLPQIRAFSMDEPNGITPKMLEVLSDTEALITLPHTPKGKTLTIAWKPTPNFWPLSQESPIVWDLTLPGQETKASIAAAPSHLSTGDSRTVTFSGADFSTVAGVSFENSPLVFKVSSDDPTSMDVVIPSGVTKDAGHKELIATTKDKKGQTGQVKLPIEVFKQ